MHALMLLGLTAAGVVACSGVNDLNTDSRRDSSETTTTLDSGSYQAPGTPTSTSPTTDGTGGTQETSPETNDDPGSDASTATTSDAGVEAGPPPASHGNEFVWVNDDFTWDKNYAGRDVAKSPPPNWYSPIDYYNGKIEVRLQVTSKPDMTPVWLELCYWQDYLGSPNHTCMHCINQSTLTKPGVYTCETKAGGGGAVDYHKPFVAMQHRVKDGTNGRGTDLANENGKGLPISAHYTVVLVPSGAQFSGWASYGF